MQFKIRKAIPGDLPVILKLGRKNVDQYERTHLGDEMADKFINSGACDQSFIDNLQNTTVIEYNGEIIGLIIFSKNIIDGFLIDSAFWGTGAAQYLMEDTLDKLFNIYDYVTLQAFASSPRANAFYLKTGWILEETKEIDGTMFNNYKYLSNVTTKL